MQEAWRAYLELALGLTDASRKKAQKVAKKLVGKSGATALQLQAVAEELVTTSLANREALTKLVRFEVDRTLGRVGLAKADEVAELTARVRDLEYQLRLAKASGAPVPAAAAATVAANAAPAKKVVKKAVAKKTVAKKAAPAAPAAESKSAPIVAPTPPEVADPAPAPAPAPAAPAKAEAEAPAKAPAKRAAAPRKTAKTVAPAREVATPRKKATPPAAGDA